MKIVDPVIVEPLLAEWAEAQGRDRGRPRPREGREVARRRHPRPQRRARARARAFLERLRGFRVLDPACGSGNFLYLALRALKDLEHRVNVEAEALGLPRAFPAVGPEAVLGIELNPYAAELARVSVWIGEIQWMRANGFDAGRNPILRPLDTIECRDAILNADGTRADWPAADVIIGNPPFLGGKLMIGSLGDDYVDAHPRGASAGALPGVADLVCYWFEKARASDRARRRRTRRPRRDELDPRRREPAGPATRSRTTCRIFDAWVDEQWIVDGAAVRVSLVCFDGERGRPPVGTRRRRRSSDDQPRPDRSRRRHVVSEARASAGEPRRRLHGRSRRAARSTLPGDWRASGCRLPLNPNGRPNCRRAAPLD